MVERGSAPAVTGLVVGALVALGFAPHLYGQTGQALAWMASALIFAFASLLIAGQVMLGRAVPATILRPS